MLAAGRPAVYKSKSVLPQPIQQELTEGTTEDSDKELVIDQDELAGSSMVAR